MRSKVKGHVKSRILKAKLLRECGLMGGVSDLFGELLLSSDSEFI